MARGRKGIVKVVIWSGMSRSVPGWSAAMDRICAAGHEVIDPEAVGAVADHAELLAEADAMIVGTNPVGSTLLSATPAVRLIAKPGIGFDNIDVDAATGFGVGVSNTPGSNSDAVADHALALMLALRRNLVSLDSVTRRGQGWQHWPAIGDELHGAVVAVVGTGNIGAAVAKRLALGFDATVLAYDVTPRPDLETSLGVRYGSLAEILPQADVVTVHVPLFAATRGLLGRQEIASMKPGAILINAARGGVVDEQALADALREERIAGAGIDVFSTEPAEDSVFFSLPNVIVTPHIAGYSRASLTRARLMIADDVISALAGQPRHLVNPDVLQSPNNRLVNRT